MLGSPKPHEYTQTIVQETGHRYKALLAAYDFGRAEFLLGSLVAALRLEAEYAALDLNDGPYLVSSLYPLAGSEGLVGPFLFHDLTGQPPKLARAWLKLFKVQVSRERYWEVDELRLLLLECRSLVADAARAMPELIAVLNDPSIEAAVKRWIQILAPARAAASTSDPSFPPEE